MKHVSLSQLLLLGALGGMAAWVAACEESKTSPTCADVAQVLHDAAPPVVDKAPEPQPDVSSLCTKDKVSCKEGELNAFGICLAPDSMVKIESGEFTMGRTEEMRPYSPEHKVTLKEFFIDKPEVTTAQYQACVDCGSCQRPLRDGSHTGREPYYGNEKFKDYPVIYVSWKNAKEYCEAIGKRLPTEAEWEKAARGKDGAEYPWGAEKPSKTTANFKDGPNDTESVTGHPDGKSPFGALNMAGNVWEWVNDTYDPNYYSNSPTSDPTGPAEGVLKVMRGGGFLSEVYQLRTFSRSGEAEGSAYSYLGFRCAKDKWP
jgi:eukaryotic-like serine/threonine-protein kinase